MLNLSNINSSSSSLYELDDHLKKIRLNLPIQWFEGMERFKRREGFKGDERFEWTQGEGEITPINRVVTYSKKDYFLTSDFDLRFEDKAQRANQALNFGKPLDQKRKNKWKNCEDLATLCSQADLSRQFPKALAKFCYPDDKNEWSWEKRNELNNARRHSMRCATKALIKAKNDSLSLFIEKFFDHYKDYLCLNATQEVAKAMIKFEVEQLSINDTVLKALRTFFFSYHLDRFYAEVSCEKMTIFPFHILKNLMVSHICAEKNQPSGLDLNVRIQNIVIKIFTIYFDQSGDPTKIGKGNLLLESLRKANKMVGIDEETLKRISAEEREKLLAIASDIALEMFADGLDPLPQMTIFPIFQNAEFRQILESFWASNDETGASQTDAAEEDAQDDIFYDCQDGTI